MANITNPGTNPGSEASQDDVHLVNIVDEALVEQIWRETQGKVSRIQIYQMVLEATGEFSEATITTFVSIFVRRQVQRQLASILNDAETSDANRASHLVPAEKAGGEEEDLSPTSRFDSGVLIWLFQTLPHER